MTRQIQDITELMVASWILSDNDPKIPTSHGLLDRGLRDVIAGGAFPTWAKTRLHFVDSRVGLQCVELPAILDWAQRSQLTTAPNPSYQTTHIQVSQWAARALLRDLEVDEAQAVEWGHKLRAAVREAVESMSPIAESGIEEY